MSKSLKQMAYDTIEAHQETIADLRTQLAKANNCAAELEVRKEALEESLNGCTEKVLSLSGKLAKANERVGKLEKGNKSCAVAIREIIAKGDIGPLLVTGPELDEIVNKFAIEQQIKGLKDYQALCGFADCRKSIDARIAQLEGQLRKEKE